MSITASEVHSSWEQEFRQNNLYIIDIYLIVRASI